MLIEIYDYLFIYLFIFWFGDLSASLGNDFGCRFLFFVFYFIYLFSCFTCFLMWMRVQGLM